MRESFFLQFRIWENRQPLFQKKKNIYTGFNQKQIGHRNHTHIQNHQNF